MIDIVWDMETNDPDDFLTLLLLAGHPQVRLKAVTILPGSPEQVGLVRHSLREWFNLDIPVGARNLDSQKPAVSQWHYDAYGSIPPSRDAQPAAEVLLKHCDSHTTLVTGAALTNLRNAINLTTDQHPFTVGRLIAQGGFAGAGVVPPELQLKQFKGLSVCPTHNLIGDTKATTLALTYHGIRQRYFVSKNVCHRVFYDRAMHDIFVGVKDKSAALYYIWQGMDVYLKTNPAGKMLHDPLTACCAIDESIGVWREVELYREGNAWGAKLSPGSQTWIIIDYDHEKFVRTLAAL